MEPSEGATDSSRIWTLPNILSISRLGLLSWALVALFDSTDRVLAGVLLAIAGTTDFLDGYVARRFHQISNLGKILDPLVDRAVLGATIIAIVVYGAIPIWLATLILVRELFVSVVGIVLAVLGAARVDVVWFGKAATFGFLIALPVFVFGHGPGTFARVLTDVAWVFVIPAVACSIAAIFSYVPVARRALEEGRATSVTTGAP